MNAVERVKSICKERKIPISKLESDCGFANGYIGQLRKGTLPEDRLRIIAKYLDLSSDYIATGEESEYTIEMAKTDAALSNASKRIKEYALKMNELSSEKQELVMNLIDTLRNN